MGINGKDKQDVFDEYFDSKNAVIIDGVDVSGCNFRLVKNGEQMCECCHATGFGVICACEMWKDCPYKQLQRLKAENEQLKSDIETRVMCIQCQRENENYKLKAENEELKKRVKEIGEKMSFLNADRCADIMRYKQALEEVREITKKYYLSDKKLLATGIMINPYNAIIEIQNKINEVQNE